MLQERSQYGGEWGGGWTAEDTWVFVQALATIAGAEVLGAVVADVVVIAAIPIAEAAVAKVGADRLTNGVLSAAGYIAGSLATGESVNLKDLGLAFVGGMVTPGGSGEGWRKLLTGAGWSGASNVIQSAASQGFGLVTGDQEEFSVDALAVDAATGAVSGVVGDLFGPRVESSLENLFRGGFRGMSRTWQVWADGIFSWAGGELEQLLSVEE